MVFVELIGYFRPTKIDARKFLEMERKVDKKLRFERKALSTARERKETHPPSFLGDGSGMVGLFVFCLSSNLRHKQPQKERK